MRSLDYRIITSDIEPDDYEKLQDLVINLQLKPDIMSKLINDCFNSLSDTDLSNLLADTLNKATDRIEKLLEIKLNRYEKNSNVNIENNFGILSRLLMADDIDFSDEIVTTDDLTDDSIDNSDETNEDLTITELNIDEQVHDQIEQAISEVASEYEDVDDFVDSILTLFTIYKKSELGLDDYEDAENSESLPEEHIPEDELMDEENIDTIEDQPADDMNVDMPDNTTLPDDINPNESVDTEEDKPETTQNVPEEPALLPME